MQAGLSLFLLTTPHPKELPHMENESRFAIAISALVVAFLMGLVGYAVVSDQVKDRVDRRVAQQVDRRVCQLMPANCPPPSAAPMSGRGD